MPYMVAGVQCPHWTPVRHGNTEQKGEAVDDERTPDVELDSDDKEAERRLAECAGLVPPQAVQRRRVAAHVVSAQLKRAGWNPGWRGRKDQDVALRVSGRGEDVSVQLDSSDPDTVAEMLATLWWLGYEAKANESHPQLEDYTSFTVRGVLEPATPRNFHTFVKCPLCDRDPQPLKKVQTRVFVFFSHKVADRSRDCEGGGLTPEQAQLIKDGTAPAPKHRAPNKEEG